MRRPRYAEVVATAALLLGLGGTAYAATSLAGDSVGTAQLRASAVTSAKVANGTLRAGDVAAGEAPRGARGRRGLAGPRGAEGARGPAGAAGETGATGPPGLQGPVGAPAPGGLSFDGTGPTGNDGFDIATVDGVRVGMACYGFLVGVAISIDADAGKGIAVAKDGTTQIVELNPNIVPPGILPLTLQSELLVLAMAAKTAPGQPVRWVQIRAEGVIAPDGSVCQYHVVMTPSTPAA